MQKNEIYFSENEIMNSQSQKNKQKEEFIFKNIFLCPLNKNDCVNSMDIFDDILIYGTIMGNVNLCRVDENNLKITNNNKFINLYNNNEINNSMNDIKDKDSHINKYKELTKISHLNLNKYENNNIHKILSPQLSDNANKYKNIFNKNEDCNYDIKDNNKNEDFLSPINKDLISIKYEKDDILLYPQVTSLISNASENISCVVFDTKDSVIISVGDLEIIKLEKISTFNMNDMNSKYDYTRVRNYTTEEDHIINCENTTCFLTSSNYLLINTVFEENNSPITMQQIPYQNKILNNLDIVKGNIQMFSFCVPFDFDGDKFLFLDYQTKDIRRICIYYTMTQKKPIIHILNKDFGHISHMKLLKDDKIFLVRKYTQCEIYKIGENFNLVEEWRHEGEEVIAVEIYKEGTKVSNEVENKYNDIYNFKSNEDMNNEGDKNISTRRVLKNDEKEVKIVFNDREHNHKKNLLKIDFNKSNNSSFRELQYNNKWNYKKVYKEGDYSNENISKKNSDNNKDQIEIYNINKLKPKSKNKEYTTNNILSNNELTDKNNGYDNFLKLKTNSINNIKNNIDINNEENIFIATLDLNGNFNLYTNKKNKVLFNLYKITNIEQKYKDEQFFSVGFPYFIVMNSLYIGISTDHGIFVIAKCKK